MEHARARRAYPCQTVRAPRRKDQEGGTNHTCQRPSTARRTQNARPARPRHPQGPVNGPLITTTRCPKSATLAGTGDKAGTGQRRRGSSRAAAGPAPPRRDTGPERPRAPGTAPTRAGAGLVGLGRLERPTSRLSGVRSNQLSYRPESHPGSEVRGRRPEVRQDPGPGPGGLDPARLCRRDVQTAARGPRSHLVPTACGRRAGSP